jgi:UDP-N-acetylmuramyl tripeptide synthase
MDISQKFKKLFWYLDAKSAAKKFPIGEDLNIVGVTGTDGKTTTSFFLYEIAKANGYKPFLITTVGAKFNDEFIDLNIKSTSFASYSLKEGLNNLKSFNLKKAWKNLTFKDQEGYEEMTELHRTTPLGSEIRRLILEYKEKGADFFILEFTSHAIHQFRTLGIKLNSIGYTNITHEHLDYHKTWENYASIKAKLMDQVKLGGSISINIDDKDSYKLLKKYHSGLNNGTKLINFGISDYENIDINKFLIKFDKNEAGEEEITAHTLKDLEENTKYHLARLNLLGKFNIYNALTALAIFYGFDNSNIETSIKALSDLKLVKGRMNVINEAPRVVIDYAHTPNAMEHVLKSISNDKGKIWVIFGCTGLRDKYKRPEMGRIAYQNADNIMITADDVRTESLYEINNQIIAGFKNIDEDFTIYTYYPELEYKSEEVDKVIVRFDEPSPNSRRNAIKFAIENAAPEDTVIMLGIGHQNSILIGETDYDWNDEKVAREYLK